MRRKTELVTEVDRSLARPWADMSTWRGILCLWEHPIYIDVAITEPAF